MGKLNSNEINSNFGKANCFGQILNIIAVVIALISVLVAYSANKKADEANTIAKEANKIALLGTSASVSMTQSGSGAVGIESCKDGDWFHIWFFTEPRIVFTNLGGVAVSLVKIEISSETSEAWGYGTGFWDKNDVYQNMSLATMKILPEEIPSGVSKDFTFVA